MDSKLPNGAFMILVIYQFVGLEFSPSIRMYDLYAVACLRFNKRLV